MIFSFFKFKIDFIGGLSVLLLDVFLLCMREMLNKYIFIACFLLSLEVVSQGNPPPGLPVDAPPGYECCEDLAPASGLEADASQEYKDCMANPAAYCTVPIDNSIYIYALMATGFALASFVIIRKIKNKKTPM